MFTGGSVARAVGSTGGQKPETDRAPDGVGEGPKLIDAISNVGVELMGLGDGDVATGDGADDDKNTLWDGTDASGTPPSMMSSAEVHFCLYMSIPTFG